MLELEIVDVEIIDGGIAVFARAFQDGSQIGFGLNGTVDIERFRIYNPPVLVLDPAGEITRVEPADPETGTPEIITKFREDPEEAILQSLEHTVTVMGNKHDASNIIANKVGNTTSTFYPSAGTVEPVDGDVFISSLKTSWTALRDGSGDGANSTGSSGRNFARIKSYTTTGQWSIAQRGIFGFDTSSIDSGDTVSSATFSLYGSDVGNFFSLSVVLDRQVPADTTTLAAGDFAISGWDGVEQSSNRITFGSWSVSGYNNFSLNATGISNVNKSGYSWYGTMTSAEFDDSAPSWSSNTDAKVSGYMADQTGTANDPKLVVEHAAGGGGFAYSQAVIIA